MIVGNVIGGNPVTPKSFVLQTPDGQEIPAVLVKEETVFTATENDIREGKIAGTENGAITGQKVIPAYHTSSGVKVVQAGKALAVSLANELELHKYTKFEAIICAYNTSLANSVAAEKVVIEDKVYPVNSVAALSTITKDDTTQSVAFGIVNNGSKPLLIRYMTYKEIE